MWENKPLTKRISLLPCNFSKPAHRKAFSAILNSYMQDPMGGCRPHDSQTMNDVIAAMSAHPSLYVQLAAIEHQIVGMAVCFVNYSTFKGAPFINIHDLAVLPRFRNLGIGKILLHGVTLKALQTKCAKVTLEVRQDNTAAQSVYSSMGFVSCSPKMEYLTKELPQMTLCPVLHTHNNVSKM